MSYMPAMYSNSCQSCCDPQPCYYKPNYYGLPNSMCINNSYGCRKNKQYLCPKCGNNPCRCYYMNNYKYGCPRCYPNACKCKKDNYVPSYMCPSCHRYPCKCSVNKSCACGMNYYYDSWCCPSCKVNPCKCKRYNYGWKLDSWQCPSCGC